MLTLAEGNAEGREHRGPEHSAGMGRRQWADLPGQSRDHVKAANIFQVGPDPRW